MDEVLDNIKEAIQLYLEILSLEERDDYLSREIVTTSLEVSVPKLPRLTAEEAEKMLLKSGFNILLETR